MVDMSTVHNLKLPQTELMTLILLLIVLPMSISQILRIEKTRKNLILVFSLILAILLSILKTLGYSVGITSFSIAIFILAVGYIVGIALMRDPSYILLSITLLISLLSFIGQSYYLLGVFWDNLGLVFELSVFILILTVIYREKMTMKEFLIIGMGAIIGFFLGLELASGDLISLIIRTSIEQLFNVSNYTTQIIQYNHFFAIHIAELFMLIALLVIKFKSLVKISLAMTAFDVSYPILGLIRLLAIILLLRSNEKSVDVSE
jgi:hypothetical protein